MINLGTFNVRLDTFIDGKHRFQHRERDIVRQFSQSLPDIMGLQEVTPSMLAFFKKALPNYTFIGNGRNKNFTGESSPIAFQTEAFTLLAFDTFWLSPKPFKPGSRYFFQSPYPRICTWGKFYHKQSNQVFRFYNTHLDHISPLARKKALEQILTTVQNHQVKEKLPLFLVGDFNFVSYKKEYALINRSSLALQNLVMDLAYTYHGFSKKTKGRAIDYIFTNLKKTSFPVTLWEKSPEGNFLSDHRGIVVSWNTNQEEELL